MNNVRVTEVSHRLSPNDLAGQKTMVLRSGKILLAVTVYPVNHLGTKLIRPIFICARSLKRNPSA